MATTHLVHGYIGAGKTTFAKRLECSLPAIRFTHDEWMGRLYGQDPPEALFAAQFDRVEALIDEVWRLCLTLGLDVVLDQGFWSRARRDAVRAMAADCGGEVRFYALACDPGLAWEQVGRRNADPQSGLFIARNTFESLRARFQPLEPDEPHEVIVG